eukprot:TRINITY_DN712_c0_g1_i2.p1 TRINITY_DN712_c0_g1~~TRINITY_DN712_c0_g1_i2.p1  ORF type:complete len:215 (+),score=43.38 TRINITY_DN712_c0_g1_i2:250-894(+)
MKNPIQFTPFDWKVNQSSFHLQGIIENSLFNIMSVVYETDLYPTWWPFVNEVTQLEKISRYRKLLYLKASLPWPLPSRDACLYGYGVDLLEDDMVIIMVRSAHNDEFSNIPDIPRSFARVECKFGGMLVKPISPTSSKVIMLSNSDPKVPVIPYWLFNLVTKKLAHHMFETLRHKSSKIEGTIYEERIRSQPEVYSDAIERLKKYENEKLIKEE